VTVTVERGVKLSMGEGAHLKIRGQLILSGTTDQPVEITRSTENGSWWSLVVYDQGVLATDHSIIEYGDVGVECHGTCTIRDTKLRYNNTGLHSSDYLDPGVVTVTNSQIYSNAVGLDLG